MLTLSQRELLNFRRVARQTVGRKAATQSRTTFASDGHSWRLLMEHGGVRLSYRVTGSEQCDPASFSVASKDLRFFEAAVDETVVIRRTSPATCSLHSLTTSVDHVDVRSETPLAVASDENAQTLDRVVLADLAHCVGMTDKDSTRYALACLELNGLSGSLAATDGRKALRVVGIDWPWEDTRLVRANGWFHSPIVTRSAHDLIVADAGGRICFRAGPWSVEIPVEQGTFPNTERIMPATSQADSVLHLTNDHHQTIAAALKSLPKPDRSSPDAVTLELGERCLLRVVDSESQACREVVLPNATFSGSPLLAALPRTSLDAVVRLGFDELMATEKAAQFFCRDHRRRFTFMQLHPECAAPAQGTVRQVEQALH